jgi:hypothetical protein
MAIKLPKEIVKTVVKQGNISADAVLLETVETDVIDYAREVSFVAIVLSDELMGQLYDKRITGGYIDCIGIIHQWAVKFVETYAHIVDWFEFLETDRTYGNCSSWDEFVYSYGKFMLSQYDDIRK